MCKSAHKWECENNGKYNKNLEVYVMNKKWVVIILSLALIMLIMPQNITAEDNSVNYDNLIIVSDDIVSEDGSQYTETFWFNSML